MTSGPEPLPIGFLLDGRHRMLRVLFRLPGRIGSLVEFLPSGERRVLWELAPAGSVRRPDGSIEVQDPEQAARFLDDAAELRRARPHGVIAVLEAFRLGSGACATGGWIEGAELLSERLARRGELPFEEVQAMGRDLLEALGGLHPLGRLAGLADPSQAVRAPSGRWLLADAGLGSEWGSSPAWGPWAAPERFSPGPPKNRASDFFGWGALVVHAATGRPPLPAIERAAGSAWSPEAALAERMPRPWAGAAAACLQLDSARRPASAAEVEALLARHPRQAFLAPSLPELADAYARLLRFHHRIGECPICRTILEKPKPLGEGVCPVCRDGRLLRRASAPGLCPICRAGRLKAVAPGRPLTWCPECRTGRLEVQRQGFGSRGSVSCPDCGYGAEWSGKSLDRPDGAMTVEAAIRRAGRPEGVLACGECETQFDPLPRGRLRLAAGGPAEDGSVELHAEEWAMMAAGHRPDAGNRFCSSCGADWHFGASTAALLRAGGGDPFGFADARLGQAIDLQLLPWIGAGKTSGRRGPACPSCGFEADRLEGGLWRLAMAPEPLRAWIGEDRPPADWARLAQALPPAGRDEELEDQLEQALRDALRTGAMAFDPERPGLAWQGPVEAVEGWSPGRARLTAWSADGIELKRGLRRLRAPWNEVQAIHWLGGDIEIEGGFGRLRLRIAPQDPYEAAGPGWTFRFEVSAEDAAAILIRAKQAAG